MEYQNPYGELQSFYGQVLLALQALIADKVPEIRYIDQDLGQLDFYHERPAVSFPCLLFDFTDTTYDQMGNQHQWGKPVLQYRLAFAAFSPSTNIAPLEVRKTALQYYELEYKLYKALQGFDAGGICQPLVRVREGSEKREDALRVRVGVYDTTFQDDGAAPAYQSVPLPIAFDFNE